MMVMVMTGVVLIGEDSHTDRINTIGKFCEQLERDCRLAGLNIAPCAKPYECVEPDIDSFSNILNNLVERQATLCICVMISDNIYGDIKYIADSVGMLTQCLKWSNIKSGEAKRGYAANVSLKVGDDERRLSFLVACPEFFYMLTQQTSSVR
jgi:hypothetical protein